MKSPSQFELTYCKCKNNHFFETLEQPKTGLRNLQNYIPFYRRFFLLSESNHNSIGLNHRHQLESITGVVSKNVVNVALKNEKEDAPVLKIPAFIKYSPLLDPIKYMSGKYNMQSADLLVLPSHESSEMRESMHQKKMHDVNNSSYVDAFFTYLTSQAMHTHGFLHGLDFYGSYLANQSEFTVNVYDELEYFSTCDFFLKHKDKLFRVDDFPSGGSIQSHSNKPILKLSDSDDLELDVLDDLNDLNANSTFDENFTPSLSEPLSELSELSELPTLCELETDGALQGMDVMNHSTDDSDSCSSRSSDSASSNNHGDKPRSHDVDLDDKNDNDNDGCSDGSSSSADEMDDDDLNSNGDEDDEVHNAHIFNFPVHAIVMEKCDNTLDSLMYGRNELTEAEWAAVLMQVIMTLVAYQHMFAFTHNDLHTNNIMFVKTEKKFLHYCYNGVYYRVPTHGRIMKIIDFGRAIYKYRGQTMVSDSFDRTGDAASQYNCEPYMNPKKPRLDPNPSFDLCRLACSLFDYFVEDIRDADDYAATLKESRVASMVVEWLKDDKERNVLYKKNGDERYPEFKLYKMIARTVHGAVPHEQLRKPMFSRFAIQRKQINGKPHIMDIDALPSYAQDQSQ
jgi:hypothetical protein